MLRLRISQISNASPAARALGLPPQGGDKNSVATPSHVRAGSDGRQSGPMSKLLALSAALFSNAPAHPFLPPSLPPQVGPCGDRPRRDAVENLRASRCRASHHSAGRAFALASIAISSSRSTRPCSPSSTSRAASVRSLWAPSSVKAIACFPPLEAEATAHPASSKRWVARSIASSASSLVIAARLPVAATFTIPVWGHKPCGPAVVGSGAAVGGGKAVRL